MTRYNFYKTNSQKLHSQAIEKHNRRHGLPQRRERDRAGNKVKVSVRRGSATQRRPGRLQGQLRGGSVIPAK